MKNRIVNDILEYINDERQTQAILIDGKWGCGKTFFIENSLIDEIEKNNKKSVIYISLYGIKDCKDITDEIYMNKIFKKINKENDSKTKKVVNISSKLAIGGINIYNTFFDRKIDIDSIAKGLKGVFETSELFDLSNDYVIIFDDLERCEIRLNEVLGYINDLVEHNKLKVIIVANEEEIGKIYINKNLEAKYNVILSNKLGLEENPKKEKCEINFTKEMLQKYTNDLFGVDLIYKSIKEKLIGFTIKFEPEIEILMDTFIENNITQDSLSMEIITRNKEKLIGIIKENKNYNLRTIIFALISIEKLINSISEENLQSQYINEITDDICLYCMKASIYLKNGEEITQYENYIQKMKVKEYKFVDEYLSSRVISSNMNEIIKNQITEYKLKDDHRKRRELSLYKLYDQWWYLDDCDVNEYINKLKVELENNKYMIEEFKMICILIAQLESNKFENSQLHEIKNIMSQNAEGYNSDVKIDLLEYLPTSDQDLQKRYSDLIKPIIEILQNKKIKKEIDFNKYINTKDGWASELYDICTKQQSIILKNKGFFKFINLQNLYTVLKNSTNRDIYDFQDTIRAIYKNNEYENDIIVIKKFIDEFDFDEIEIKTKKMALNSLITTLKTISGINEQV